ncbi:hypothetical protein MTO96_026710 [Rhipicephalus appendiculatus]
MPRFHQIVTNYLKKLTYAKRFTDQVKIVMAQKGVAQFELRLEKEHCDLQGTMHNDTALILIDLYTWATACTMYDEGMDFMSLNIEASCGVCPIIQACAVHLWVAELGWEGWYGVLYLKKLRNKFLSKNQLTKA